MAKKRIPPRKTHRIKASEREQYYMLLEDLITEYGKGWMRELSKLMRYRSMVRARRTRLLRGSKA